MLRWRKLPPSGTGFVMLLPGEVPQSLGLLGGQLCAACALTIPKGIHGPPDCALGCFPPAVSDPSQEATVFVQWNARYPRDQSCAVGTVHAVSLSPHPTGLPFNWCHHSTLAGRQLAEPAP